MYIKNNKNFFFVNSILENDSLDASHWLAVYLKNLEILLADSQRCLYSTNVHITILLLLIPPCLLLTFLWEVVWRTVKWTMFHLVRWFLLLVPYYLKNDSEELQWSGHFCLIIQLGYKGWSCHFVVNSVSHITLKFNPYFGKSVSVGLLLPVPIQLCFNTRNTYGGGLLASSSYLQLHEDKLWHILRSSAEPWLDCVSVGWSATCLMKILWNLFKTGQNMSCLSVGLKVLYVTTFNHFKCYSFQYTYIFHAKYFATLKLLCTLKYL